MEMLYYFWQLGHFSFPAFYAACFLLINFPRSCPPFPRMNFIKTVVGTQSPEKTTTSGARSPFAGCLTFKEMNEISCFLFFSLKLVAHRLKLSSQVD